MKKFDIESAIWQKFNKLTVISYSHQKWCGRYFVCRCDCGIEKVYCWQNIKNGLSKSCGCWYALNINDYLWKKFWRLEITKHYKIWNKTLVDCKCDCWWSKKWVYLWQLWKWINSCWCLATEVRAAGHPSHWFSRWWKDGRHRLYQIWIWVKSRCNREKDKAYRYYWGRGIKLLWQSFDDFKNDMYDSYEKHVENFGEKETTLERISTDGHYCKENCKRATNKEQANNRSNNVWYDKLCIYKTKDKIKRVLLAKRPLYDIKNAICKKNLLIYDKG